ncbi:MAG: YqjK-like family protein [Sterolibacteriaceae bacterium MAG5]|nr:YqjK-like family protein [Candidatus Nitricoxidireducens bremensis]
MNPQVELALKKQRLQLRSAALRDEFAGHGAAFAPLFAAGDGIREGFRWLRRHPEALVATVVAAAVARPRVLFRWARRSVIVWQAWDRFQGWLASRRRARLH